VTPEIRAFEYAMGLFSVLIGLAVADIATSFHRLVRSRSTVTWDPLTLLGAFFALCLAIGMWFDLWGVRNVTATRHFFFYMSIVAELFIVFLIAAASLPEEAHGGVDLRAFYAENRRYFWSLVAVFEVGYLVHGFYFIGSFLDRMPREIIVATLVQWIGAIVIPIVLVLVKRRSVHYVGLVLLFAIQAWHYAPYSIN
jgi:hypothetical protein